MGLWVCGIHPMCALINDFVFLAVTQIVSSQQQMMTMFQQHIVSISV